MLDLKKKFYWFFTIFMVLTTVTAFAQDELSLDKDKVRKNGLGLHAGSTTGLGFSYRYWPDEFGFQVTFLPIISSSQSFVSLGFTGMYKLSEKKAVDLFAYAGNHFIYRKNNYYYDSTYDNSSWTWNFGLGVGMDIKIAKVMRLSLMTGLGNYDILGDYTFTVAGEIGYYYMF
ncbi:MAG: hypothetical protein J7L04_01225 [Bacteroidales bacterium]|nr:hypothetical protein [Bacteroidales bacterium]